MEFFMFLSQMHFCGKYLFREKFGEIGPSPNVLKGFSASMDIHYYHSQSFSGLINRNLISQNAGKTQAN